MHVQQKIDALFTDISRFRGCQIPADPFIYAIEEIREMVRGCSDHAVADEPWIALPKAMLKTGLSASYFRANLAVLDGRSRLQQWRERGLAKQEGRNWFISTSIQLPLRIERVAVAGAPPNGSSAVSHPRYQRMNLRLV